MILLRSILILSLFAVACSSSEPENVDQQPRFPNLISLTQPGDQDTSSSKVYVDSVQWIEYEQKKSLLISGNLANGCTYLQDASHTMAGDSLQISLVAWKPANKMCTQALVPFSFIYDKLPQAIAESHAEVIINQQGFKLKVE